MRGAIGLIRNYDFLIDLLTVAFQTPSQDSKNDVDYQSLIDQKVTSLIRQSKKDKGSNSTNDNDQPKEEDVTDDRVKAQIEELKRLKDIIRDRQSLEDVILILFRSINLYRMYNYRN